MSSRTKRYLPLLLTTALVTYTAHHAAHAQEAWSQFNTEHGSISIDTSTINQTLINQSGNLYIGSSNNLNINANQSVTIGQDNNDALFVAKAQNGSDPTRILGTLQTRTKDASGAFTNSVGGSVMILDGNGVFFGRDAVIDSHGIVASTGQVDNNELINAVNTKGGRVSLSNFGNGAIVNEGTISVSDGGLAAFVAPNVVNNGIITARAGRVELVGANTKSTVDLYGDGLVEIEVNDSNTEKLLVENKGTIDAAGGVVHLTTGAAERIVDSVINMDGVVTASSVTQKGGKIVLGGAKTGQVNVGGTVTADGATGGGEVTVKAAEVTVKAAAEVSASATQNGDGGTVLFLGRDLAILNGRVRARGGSQGGNGGFVELSSDRDFQIAGNVDTTALHGKSGVFLIDPRDLAILIGSRPGGVTSGLYESDIEALSVTTDIDLLARRNITVSADVTGFSDGIISIANGHNLTIRTTNAPYFAITFNPFQVITEVDNSGTIDLTGNTTYGKNLEWKTTGNGSISILGATDNLFSSNIKVGKLTTDAGSVTVDTDNGKVEINGGIATNGGAVNVNSTLRTTIASQIATNGGSITLTGNNNSASNSGVEITSAGSVNSAGGNVAMTSSNAKIQIDGAVNAGTGDVTLQGNSIVFNNDVIADDLALTSSSTVSQTGGKITGDVLTASATGSIALNAAANDLNSLGNITASTLSLTDADDLALTGTVATTGNGNVLLTTGGALAVNGTLNTGNGNISLTADSITQGASGKVTGNTLSGLVQQSANLNSTTNDLNSIGNFTTAAASGSYGGFTYNDADDIALNGTIVTGGQSIIVGSQGAMTVAGSLQSNGGHTVLNSNNANLTVTGTINSGAGDVGLTGAAIVLNGTSSVTAGNRITLSGASVSQDLTSKIAGELLSATTTGAVSLTGTNNDINTLGSVNASSFALNDVDGLTVDGNVTTTGGNVSIKGNGTAFNATGNVTINAGKTIASNGGDITVDASASGLIVRGNVNAGSGDATLKGRQVQLNGSSAVTADNVDLTTMLVSQQAGSKVVANTLTGTVQTTASLTGANNDVGSIGNFATGLGSGAGGFTFNDVNGVNVSGAVSTDGGAVSITSHGATAINNGATIISNGGDVALNSNTGDLAIDGAINAGAGDINLQANAISQAATGQLTGDALTGTVQQNAAFSSVLNDLNSIGTFTTAAASGSYGGFTYNDVDDLVIDGTIVTGGQSIIVNSTALAIDGTLLSNGGHTVLNSNGGDLSVSGTINSGAGDVSLTGGDIKLTGTSSVTAGNLVNLSGASVSQAATSKIVGEILTAATTDAIVLTGTDNDVNTLNAISGGSVAFNDVDGFAVDGDITATGGNISLKGNGTAFNATGNVTINAGKTIASNGGDITVDASASGLIVRGNVNAGSGDATLKGRQVQLNGNSAVTADNVDLTTMLVSQQANSKVIANTLTGTVQQTASLTGTNNDVGSIDNFATGLGSGIGGFTFNDVNGVNVSGAVSTDGGAVSITSHGATSLDNGGSIASNGGNVTLNSNGGSLAVDGTLDAGAGDVSLTAASISQASTGKVLSDDLTVQSTGSVVLNSTANDVNTLGTVNATSFRFRDADDLTVAGDVTTTGGIAAIRSNGLTVNGDVASGNGNITLNGSTGTLAINSDINAGTGDVALNGSTVLLNATSVVSGDEVDVTAGLLSQDISGKITGRKLTGQIQQTASLLGTDNDLDVIGDFGTGLDGSAGGFAYNDVDGVDVNGDVTTNGGAIDLALTGDLTVNGRINAGSGDLTVGATTVALNGGSVVRADDIAITADSVTQGATGKIVADTLTAQVQNGLSLTGTDNDLAALNDIETAAGDIAFNDVNGVVIDGDITTQGGSISITGNGASAGATRNVILNAGKTVASNGGNITLAANGANLVIDGSVAGGNGTTDLSGSVIRLKNGSTVDSRRVNVTGGSLQQGVNSVLIANRLTGALQEDAVFNGRNNDVATLGDFATGLSASHKGGLTLVDENGLNVVGAVTSDSTGASGTGAIDIATKGGALTFTGTSSVVTEGGDMNIASNRRINIRQGAVIDLQSGNAFVDAPRVNLGADIGTTGTIDGTASIVNVLNDTAQIQDGVDVAANNATVNVSAGNYTGNVVVDKTLNLYGAQAGVDARNRTGLTETVVSGAFGFDVQADNTLIDGFEITNGAGSGPLTDGVRVNGAANVTVQNNKITGMNGAAVSSNSFLGIFTSGLKVLTNWFSGNGSGANLSNSDNALVQNNLVEGNTGAGIRVFGSNGSTIDNNELNGNGIGIEVAGDNGVSTDISSDTLIQSNALTSNTVGIKTTGNGVGDVIIADNLLTDNTTGMLFEGGEIDISTLTAPNQITGGTTGIRIDRTLSGNPVSLTNNSLGSTIFDGQSGNYVELANGALSGTTIDGLAASFDGVVPLNSVLGAGLLTAVDRLAIESKLFDFDDDNGLGQILVGLNLNADEKDLFSLGLYSLQPQTGNVRVTIAGLPRVSLTSNVSLAAISPAAGVNARFASASDLANIETAAGGNDNGEDLASVEPAAGGKNGCWASADSANLGAQVVNFSFGPDVNSAIKDSSCAD